MTFKFKPISEEPSCRGITIKAGMTIDQLAKGLTAYSTNKEAPSLDETGVVVHGTPILFHAKYTPKDVIRGLQIMDNVKLARRPLDNYASPILGYSRETGNFFLKEGACVDPVALIQAMDLDRVARWNKGSGIWQR